MSIQDLIDALQQTPKEKRHPPIFAYCPEAGLHFEMQRPAPRSDYGPDELLDNPPGMTLRLWELGM